MYKFIVLLLLTSCAQEVPDAHTIKIMDSILQNVNVKQPTYSFYSENNKIYGDNLQYILTDSTVTFTSPVVVVYKIDGNNLYRSINSISNPILEVLPYQITDEYFKIGQRVYYKHIPTSRVYTIKKGDTEASLKTNYNVEIENPKAGHTFTY